MIRNLHTPTACKPVRWGQILNLSPNLHSKSEVSLAFRNATLELAKDFEFARRFVNPGRLSTPSVLDGSPLNTPDEDEFSDRQRPDQHVAARWREFSPEKIQRALERATGR